VLVLALALGQESSCGPQQSVEIPRGDAHRLKRLKSWNGHGCLRLRGFRFHAEHSLDGRKRGYVPRGFVEFRAPRQIRKEHRCPCAGIFGQWTSGSVRRLGIERGLLLPLSNVRDRGLCRCAVIAHEIRSVRLIGDRRQQPDDRNGDH